MIETNERGDQQIAELVESLELEDWNAWELDFIKGLRKLEYAKLTRKQCAIVTRLHAKLLGVR